MAYQRPFLISLKRSNSQQPWGFRTFGGTEYGQPHSVEKVLDDSVAELAGLHVGDEVIQVGRVNVQQMSFGQVQEVLARCGNKIEMFVIREDFLSGRKGKEPPTVKAVVHNPYNSPLSLYSTENIAETLAKQTEVLTEGRISPSEEEEGPENLSFKQKSAVFQLLEEQSKTDTPVPVRGISHKKAPAPPPPKPIPPTSQQYQNKENYNPQQSTVTYTTTQKQSQQSYHSAYTPSDQYTHQVIQNSVEHYPESAPKRSVTFQTQNQQQQQRNYPTSAHPREVQKVVSSPPTPPTRGIPQRIQNGMASTYTDYQQQQYCDQQQQPQYHQTQQRTQQRTQQYQDDRHYQSNQQWTQQQPQQQQQQRTVVHHPVQSTQQKQDEQYREAIYEDVPEPVGTPIMYKAPPTQKHRVNWPPSSPVQQNGRWESPSPTPTSPSRVMGGIWPPKQPTVRDLPKTGFNPGVIREQGTGRRCVWPPPKSEDNSGRTTPQSPVMGRRINWNPSPSPPVTRKALSFETPSSPGTRRKDIAWPPPSPPTYYKENHQDRQSTFTRRNRFDDFIRQHAGNNVPCTYRPPPGTQRVEYC